MPSDSPRSQREIDVDQCRSGIFAVAKSDVFAHQGMCELLDGLGTLRADMRPLERGEVAHRASDVGAALPQIAGVEHDAVGRWHRAKAGIREERQQGDGVGARSAPKRDQQDDPEQADDEHGLDDQPHRGPHPRAALLDPRQRPPHRPKAGFEERFPAADLHFLDAAEALLQHVQLLLFEQFLSGRRIVPTRGV